MGCKKRGCFSRLQYLEAQRETFQCEHCFILADQKIGLDGCSKFEEHLIVGIAATWQFSMHCRHDLPLANP